MSSEASVVCSLSINKNNLNYTSRPSAYTADVIGTKGPVPGAITVTKAGVSVDLSGLTTPGLCWMQNLDEDNYVAYGIYEPDTTLFYPLGELLPGETVVLRLSRDLSEQYEGVGTGTGVANNSLRLKAFGTGSITCVCRVEVFEV